MLEQWTTHKYVGIIANMRAEPLLHERHILRDDAFAELVIWELPNPLKASVHNLKYRLACVIGGRCVLRYDNEAGKGDHRHIGRVESAYRFTSIEQLLTDFWTDMDKEIQR